MIALAIAAVFLLRLRAPPARGRRASLRRGGSLFRQARVRHLARFPQWSCAAPPSARAPARLVAVLLAQALHRQLVGALRCVVFWHDLGDPRSLARAKISLRPQLDQLIPRAADVCVPSALRSLAPTGRERAQCRTRGQCHGAAPNLSRASSALRGRPVSACPLDVCSALSIRTVLFIAASVTAAGRRVSGGEVLARESRHRRHRCRATGLRRAPANVVPPGAAQPGARRPPSEAGQEDHRERIRFVFTMSLRLSPRAGGRMHADCPAGRSTPCRATPGTRK